MKTAKTYTFSYTYTGETLKITVITDRCDIHNLTQNQVVETSCWFESGQGTSSFAIFESVAQANRNRLASFYEQGSRRAGLNKGDGLKLVRDDHFHSGPVTLTVPASSPACTGAKAKADS